MSAQHMASPLLGDAKSDLEVAMTLLETAFFDSGPYIETNQISLSCPPSIVQELLDRPVISGQDRRGNDVHYQTESAGNTPLHIASSHGHFDTSLMLVNHGADIYMTNGAGETPLEIFGRDTYPPLAPEIKIQAVKDLQIAYKKYNNIK